MILRPVWSGPAYFPLSDAFWIPFGCKKDTTRCYDAIKGIGTPGRIFLERGFFMKRIALLSLTAVLLLSGCAAPAGEPAP